LNNYVEEYSNIIDNQFENLKPLPVGDINVHKTKRYIEVVKHNDHVVAMATRVDMVRAIFRNND